MSFLALMQHYPAEALPYEIGFALLALSMIWYSIVMRRMVGIIHGGPIWLLPLIGALAILASVGMHSFAYLALIPKLDAMTSVGDINHMTTFLLQWRTWSLAGILVGGVFSLAGGAIYYRWTTR